MRHPPSPFAPRTELGLPAGVHARRGSAPWAQSCKWRGERTPGRHSHGYDAQERPKSRTNIDNRTTDESSSVWQGREQECRERTPTREAWDTAQRARRQGWSCDESAAGDRDRLVRGPGKGRKSAAAPAQARLWPISSAVPHAGDCFAIAMPSPVRSIQVRIVRPITAPAVCSP